MSSLSATELGIVEQNVAKTIEGSMTESNAAEDST